jgi:hypothetical protein
MAHAFNGKQIHAPKVLEGYLIKVLDLWRIFIFSLVRLRIGFEFFECRVFLDEVFDE